MARNRMPGDSEYTRPSDEGMTNDELITELSQEYETALVNEDYEMIEDDIAPRFWARFAPYYNEYRTLWVNPEQKEHPDNVADRYMLQERNMGKVQMDWMDQVLRGEIEIGDEMDEEPSEY